MDFTVSIEEKTCSQLFKRRGLHLMKPVRTRLILTFRNYRKRKCSISRSRMRKKNRI
jgi:hypothetical protein